jgi:translation elongation factor EF-G
MSIEPRSAADRTKLGDAMEALRREDPTFSYKTDKETGQTVISGMGELHLEILQHKLVKDMNVDVRVGKPRVAYKETITQSARAEGKFIHQSGGRGQYGHVVWRSSRCSTQKATGCREWNSWPTLRPIKYRTNMPTPWDGASKRPPETVSWPATP